MKINECDGMDRKHEWRLLRELFQQYGTEDPELWGWQFYCIHCLRLVKVEDKG